MRKKLILAAIVAVFIFNRHLLAQDSKGGSAQDNIATQCQKLYDDYSAKNKYRELVASLNSLWQKNKNSAPYVNYYLALARYRQLKYLEETQSWDEYFSRGNDYREEIVNNTQKVIDNTKPQDKFNIYSRLLLWQFHKDQQDVFTEEALSGLMDAVSQYAQSATDPKIIKEIADKLYSYEEKGKARQAYKLYVDKIINSGVSDGNLVEIASGFYQEGNMELAETLYDVYIERISKSYPKEKLVPILIEIAKLFAYKDEGMGNPEYAEEVFKKMEEVAGLGAFDEELIYLRGFNLEKMKSFAQSKKLYQALVDRYPKTSHVNEVFFKMGAISAYYLRDIKAARGYFEKMAQLKNVNSWELSSFYHLGLLSQWEGNLEQARRYYDRLLEKAAAGGYPESVALAKERILEIEEEQPIEYNLKTFLDSALKDSDLSHDRTKLYLNSKPYRAKTGAELSVGSNPYLTQTGCLQVEITYLWSGNTGSAKPSEHEASFKTSYSQIGTKEIFVVVVSPTGVVDWDIDFVDIE